MTPIQPNLDYPLAIPIMVPHADHLQLVLIGCGGTGSFLALHVARLAVLLQDSYNTVSVIFIDPDHVTDSNIPRSHFCTAEIGKNKAETLAARYSQAWGIPITTHATAFSSTLHIPEPLSSLTILIGAVDTIKARKLISQRLNANRPHHPHHHWYLDTGNDLANGQVLLGSGLTPKTLKNRFLIPSWCQALPAPSLIEPQLFTAAKEPKTPIYSCREQMLREVQSLTINSRVAAEAADFLTRLLFTKDLRRFATYFDTTSGSARSLYVTPKTIATLLSTR